MARAHSAWRAQEAAEEVVKDMEVLKGLFTFYRKAEDNRILMEVLPEQLDKTFLFAATVDQSVGERGLYAAQMGGSFPFSFRKLGKNVHWIIKNPTFTAENGTPAARAGPDHASNSVLPSADCARLARRSAGGALASPCASIRTRS